MAAIEPIKQNKKQKDLFDDKVQLIIGFIQRHYKVIIPLRDYSKMQIICKDKNRYKYPPTFDDLSLHLMSEGISVSDNILRKILRSPNKIAPVNPIKDYFDSVRGKWQGKSHIDLLCEHIKPRCFDGNNEEHYKNRTNTLFKKWLVACVAQWLGGVPNDVSLGLVEGAGGSGKTFLSQFLLPDELTDFYTQASKEDKNFNLEDAYTRFMLVNFEELNGLKKGNFNTYKALQSSKDITTKTRYEEFPTKKPRLACSIFSTNFNQENGGFIQPWYGSDTRRLGIIEINGIDQSYASKVNKDELWSEALTLYESGTFEYKFTRPDYEEFNTYNQRYKFETPAMYYVQLCMEEAINDSDGEKLNATQIVERLIARKKIQSKHISEITPQKMGYALSVLGYTRFPYRDASDNNKPKNGYKVRFK